MSDKPEVERTNEELAAMREYNEAPADALEGVPKMFHTAIHYAYRCGRTDADRRRRELDGMRIEGWAWPTDLVDKEAFDNGNLEAKWLSFELWKNREELVEAVRATGDTIHHVTVIYSKDPIMDMVDRDMDKRADVFRRLTNSPEENDE